MIGKLRNNRMAIIGISVQLPNAHSLSEFWTSLSSKVCALQELPRSRMVQTLNYIDYKNMNTDDLLWKRGGYLKRIDTFDYPYFSISPKEAELMDPNQRLLLENSFKAFQDAGIPSNKLLNSKTGVFIGYSGQSEYKTLISEMEPQSLPIATAGNVNSMMAGRISYLLGLKGPSLLIDTACSSSLTAVHYACKSLMLGECDIALCGSVKINILPFLHKTSGYLGIESSDGKTKTFDDSSDGAGFGEGVISIVLKPYGTAINNGDNIYAVILGSAINQDGKSMGLTAPNPKAQERLLIDAWTDAGISPEDMGYLEAHGTGTKLGDPVEVYGIASAMQKFTSKRQFCAIGSVKSNLGHLDHTAGLAGIVKCALALKKKQIPPSLHFSKPNRKINFIESPVYVNTELKEWESSGKFRISGVSAFGFSGTNCHIVLSEAEDETQTEQHTVSLSVVYAIILSAKSVSSLKRLLYDFSQYDFSLCDSELANVAYTLSACRDHYAVRVAFEVSAIEEINHCCKRALELIDRSLQSTKIWYSELLYRPPADSFASQLCERYVNNECIPWSTIYFGKKISLPTYCFDQYSCWLGLSYQRIAPKEKRWIQMELSSNTDTSVKKILIFSNNTEKADAMIELLQTQNKLVSCIPIIVSELSSRENGFLYNIYKKQYDMVQILDYFREEQLDTTQIIVISAYNYDLPNGILPENIEEQLTRYYSLLDTLNILTKRLVQNPISLFVIVWNASIKPVNCDSENPVNAMLNSTVVVFSHENTDYNCCFLDTDDSIISMNLESILCPNMKAVKIRNMQCYCEEYVPMHLPEADKLALDSQGAYVIIGGNSGIGMEIAKAITSINTATVILVSRSITSVVHSSSALFRSQLKKCGENDSTVECISCDVSNLQQSRTMFHSIIQRHGKINGIFHCGGISSNNILSNTTKHEISEVIRSKVHGSIVLASMLNEFQIPFLVLSSSLITFNPKPGQAVYMAANAFQDSFATNVDRIVAINWPSWKHTGMSYRYWASKGADYANIGDIEPYQGTDILFRIIASGKSGRIILDYKKQESIKVEHQEYSVDTRKWKTQIEKDVVSIWQQFLGYLPVEGDEDFYALGGDSIIALQIANGLTEKGYRISVADIVVKKTVDAQVALLSERVQQSSIQHEVNNHYRISMEEKEQICSQITEKTSVKCKAENVFVLPPSQERMLFHALFYKNHLVNVQTVSFVAKGYEFDSSMLEKCFKLTLSSSDIFRLRFYYANAQRAIGFFLGTQEDLQLPYEFYDISSENGMQKNIFIDDMWEQCANTVFDLQRGMMVKLRVVRLAYKSYRFFLTYHHIIMDGSCGGVFFEIFFQHCFNVGKAKKTYSFKSYYQWLLKFDEAAADSFWSHYHANGEPSRLLPNKSKKAFGEERVIRTKKFLIDRKTTTILYNLALSNELTISSLLYALWGEMLQHILESTDVTFGVVSSGRPSEVIHVNEILGMFATVVAIHIREKRSLLETARDIQFHLPKATDFSYLPVAKMMRYGNRYDHVVIVESQKISEDKIFSQYEVDIVNFTCTENSHHDFSCIFVPSDEIEVRLNYCLHVISEKDVERIIDCLMAIIKKMEDK